VCARQTAIRWRTASLRYTGFPLNRANPARDNRQKFNSLFADLINRAFSTPSPGAVFCLGHFLARSFQRARRRSIRTELINRLFLSVPLLKFLPSSLRGLAL
jgi:hypothetical protein